MAIDWNAVGIGAPVAGLFGLVVLSVVLVLRNPPAREFWVNAFVKAAARLLDAAVLALTKMLEREMVSRSAGDTYNPALDTRLNRVQALRDGLREEVGNGV